VGVVEVGVVDTRYGVSQPGADAERYRCTCLHCSLQGPAGQPTLHAFRFQPDVTSYLRVALTHLRRRYTPTVLRRWPDALKPRLHDTTCCQNGCTTRFNNRLNEQWLFVQHGCQTGCHTVCAIGCTTGLTTGCIVQTGYKIQDVPVPLVETRSMPSFHFQLLDRSCSSCAAIVFVRSTAHRNGTIYTTINFTDDFRDVSVTLMRL